MSLQKGIMKREVLFERREQASRTEAVMWLIVAVSVIAAIFAFLNLGWLAALGFLLVGGLAYGVSRVLELIGEVFASIHALEASTQERTAVAAGKVA